MKKIFILHLLFVLLLVGCNNDKAMKPDTPTNAATLMEFHISSQNYSAFQSLFYEGTEENVSKSTFQQFNELSTQGADLKTYELITFTNGEMLLVEFAPKSKDEDKYKTVNVKEVPDSMKILFNQ
ncbi:hypothetical protein [Aquibacillus sediminis]|uniref:hypothetical protein n=1 Tax=Aquibacillus sediminis TaxID=2574734 RepID=UPI0011083C39|nr:hypothetical protein [Aquibacillus sediminis]